MTGRRQVHNGEPTNDLGIRPEPAAWSVSVEDIFSDDGLRLDAGHFDPGAGLHMDCETIPLSDWAEVRFIRDRGRKVFTNELASGTKPYLNATEFQALLSFAQGPERFIAEVSNLDFNAFLIRHGWLLVTRSGTLGQSILCHRAFRWLVRLRRSNPGYSESPRDSRIPLCVVVDPSRPETDSTRGLWRADRPH